MALKGKPADKYGGEDRREKPEKDNGYADKGSHKERSLANDNRPGGQQEHWKKQRPS